MPSLYRIPQLAKQEICKKFYLRTHISWHLITPLEWCINVNQHVGSLSQTCQWCASAGNNWSRLRWIAVLWRNGPVCLSWKLCSFAVICSRIFQYCSITCRVSEHAACYSQGSSTFRVPGPARSGLPCWTELRVWLGNESDIELFLVSAFKSQIANANREE